MVTTHMQKSYTLSGLIIVLRYIFSFGIAQILLRVYRECYLFAESDDVLQRKRSAESFYEGMVCGCGRSFKIFNVLTFELG